MSDLQIEKFVNKAGAPHKRYVVVGTSGSGKTTLAGELAQALDCPHYELDEIQWLPNWQIRPAEEFRAAVAKLVVNERWVIDGNYSHARDLVWPRADAVIWLDRPFHVVMRRVIRRSLLRAISGQELWGGCRENLQRSFLSRESIILWAAQTWLKNRRKYERLTRLTENRHLDIYRVCSPDLSDVQVRYGCR